MADFTAPKGVPDYVPPLSRAFVTVRDTLLRAADRAGYSPIELPLFEDTALFTRGVGESTDVVSKEMYTFADRGGRSVTLRPEGTAGVMRAVIEHGLDRGPLPVKLVYSGAFFRYERPQAGRYRQLQQVGIEAIGTDDPALDAEVIAVADEGFRDARAVRLPARPDLAGRHRLPARLPRAAHRVPGRTRPRRGDRGTRQDQPAAGAGRQAAAHAGAAGRRTADDRPPVPRVPGALRPGAGDPRRAGACPTCSTRGWCADWTTTPAPPSSSCIPAWVRSPGWAAAGGTTG